MTSAPAPSNSASAAAAPVHPDSRLAREVKVSATWARVARTLAGVLAVAVVGNFLAMAYFRRWTANEGYWLIEQKWYRLMSLDKPVDWMLIGDSSCNQGLVPDVMSKRLGGEVQNFCVIGNMLALNGAWMVDAHIRRVGPPKHVVAMYVYDVWPRDPNPILLAHVPLPWGYWSNAQPALSLSAVEQLKVAAARYFPLFAQKKTIAFLAENPSRLWTQPAELNANGFMVSALPDTAYVLGDAKDHRAFVRGNHFQISEPNKRALEHLIALAEQYHFDLYLVNGPSYEGLLRDEPFRAYYNDMRTALEGYSGRSRYVHYLSAPRPFPLAEMNSTDHVIFTAAQRLTEQVSAEIAAARSGAQP